MTAPRRLPPGRLLIGSVLALAGMTGTVRGATFQVSFTQDDLSCFGGRCSLRAAVDQANRTAGQDEIRIAGNTYPLTTGELLVTESVVITSDGTGDVVIDGGDRSRLFHVVGTDVVLDLRAVTLKGGNANKQTAGESCGQQGGAVCGETGTTVQLTDVKVESSLGRRGGALSVANASVTTSSLSGNTASDGALAGLTPAPNGLGGAIIAVGGSLTLTASTLDGNKALLGAAVFASDCAQVKIESSTIDGNLSSGVGTGGIDVEGATTNVSLRDVTVTGNTQAGVYLAAGVTATVTNSLVFGQDGPACAGPGTITGGPILELLTGTTTATCPGSIRTASTQLGALADNGGKTKTRELLRNSDAVDAGTGCLAQDQRGRPRDAQCDIGAFELVAEPPPPPPDRDDDGIPDANDNCPDVKSDNQADSDCDGKGDVCDQDAPVVAGPNECLQERPNCLVQEACPCGARPDGTPWRNRKEWKRCAKGLLPSCTPKQQVKDVMQVGKQEACGAGDADHDGAPNTLDNCPHVRNSKQRNCDLGGEQEDGVAPLGDACDDDVDNDGRANDEDNCRYQPNSSQHDRDGDRVGDECDCCPLPEPAAKGKKVRANGCADVQTPNPSLGQFPGSACDADEPKDAPKKNCYLPGATGWEDAAR